MPCALIAPGSGLPLGKVENKKKQSQSQPLLHVHPLTVQAAALSSLAVFGSWVSQVKLLKQLPLAKNELMLDTLFYLADFCRKQSFNPEKTSVLFYIVGHVHALTISTPHDNLDAAFALFKELLHKHNVQRPPFSEAVYTLQDSQAIMTYVLSEYFQHFKLYKYCFTPTIVEHVKFDVEEIPIPIPEPEPEPAAPEGEGDAEAGNAAEEGDADAAGAAVDDADTAAAADVEATAGAGEDGAGGEEEEPVPEDVLAFTATVRARLEPMRVSLQRRIEKEVMEKDSPSE